MKNDTASPSSTPSSIMNTPSGLSHGPQMTPHTRLPARSFNVKFCCDTGPAALHRTSSCGVFHDVTDFIAAVSVPSPRIRFNVTVDGTGALLLSVRRIDNVTWPSSVETPSATRNAVDGSSHGPHIEPTTCSP